MLTALFLSISSFVHVATPDSICGIQTAPSTESFQDSTWRIGALIFSDPGDIGPCWSRSDTTGFYWTPFVGITSGGFTGPYSGAGGSGKYLYTSPSSGPSATSLLTPRYYMAPLDTAAIEFYTHILEYTTGDFVSMVVSADTGSGWFPMQTITTSTQIVKNSPWDRRIIYLNPFRADTMQFKFTVTRAPNAYLKVGLDAFSVRDTTCPPIASPYTYSGTGLTRSFALANPKPNFSYQWYFGDGGSSTSTTPTHSYSSPGSYTITLVTTSECGRIDSTQGTLQICAPSQPSISYSLSGNTVSFLAQGSGIANVYWSFGDGASSTAQNPTHTYANTGAFTVQLSATNTCGESTTAYDTVRLCSPLSPQFTAQILSTNAQGMTVQFDAAVSLGSIQSYQWNFGDNSTGTGQSPKKTYVIPGLNYLVTLSTLDSCGQTLSISKPLTQVSLPNEAVNRAYLYPNPAQQRIFLRAPGSQRLLEGKIYHTNGTLVDLLPAGTSEWDILPLPAGIYYVVLTYPDQSVVLPLVVERP